MLLFLTFSCLFGLSIVFSMYSIVSLSSLVMVIVFSIFSLFNLEIEFLSYVLLLIYIGGIVIIFLVRDSEGVNVWISLTSFNSICQRNRV